MSDVVSVAGPRFSLDRSRIGQTYIKSRGRFWLKWVVTLWIFSGAMVLTEPAPYELLFLIVLPVALVAGVGLHRSTLGLFLLIAAFTPFALIGAFQVKFSTVPDAILYNMVTIFLMITGYFVANYIADAPFERMRTLLNAYLATALVSAVVGTTAYLGLLPGEDLFLLYGRAKAGFEDPNVFGPFLILPAAFVLQRLLLGNTKQAFWGGALFGILFIGIFVSFSRAAWGSIVIAAGMTFVLCFLLEANARQKVRMLILALVGSAGLIVALAGLLSIPSVNELFLDRASLTQSYDTGESGRFGRQGYAFGLALEHPWGLGPLEFRNLSVAEEPHNTYVNVIHAYGWGGGLAYWAMIGLTLWRGTLVLGVKSRNRLLLIPVFATFVPLALQSAIIDTDHWRHFFLLMGMVWGVTAGYRKVSDEQTRSPGSALI